MTDFKDMFLGKKEADILLKEGIDCGEAVAWWTKGHYQHSPGIYDLYIKLSENIFVIVSDEPHFIKSYYKDEKPRNGISTYTSDQLWKALPEWVKYYITYGQGDWNSIPDVSSYEAFKEKYDKLCEKHYCNWLLINFHILVYLKKEGLM